MRRRGGFILPLVLFVLVITSVVAVASYNLANDERSSQRGRRQSAIAFLAADAGLHHTLDSFPTAASLASLLPNSGDSIIIGTDSGGWHPAANGARYRAVIYRVDAKGGDLQLYQLVVQGRRFAAARNSGQATVMAMVSGVPAFTYAIYTENGITLGGGATIDSYNSAAGPYSSAHHDSSGNIATAATFSGAITVVLSTVMGSAAAGGTISTIAGAITGGSSPNLPAASFPTPPLDSCPSENATYHYTPRSQLGTLPSHVSYDSTTGALSLTNGASLTLSSPPGIGTYYFSSVTLSGNSTITDNTAGHVDIYVSGQVNLSGGVLVNASGVATGLGLWACGNPTSPPGWTLSGGSGAAFTVYAPNEAVSIAGSGALYGSIVAKSWSNLGGSALHYDEALTNAGTNVFTMVRGTWGQIVQ